MFLSLTQVSISLHPISMNSALPRTLYRKLNRHFILKFTLQKRVKLFLIAITVENFNSIF